MRRIEWEQIEADLKTVCCLQNDYSSIDSTMPLYRIENIKEIYLEDLKRLISSNDGKEKEILDLIVRKVIAVDDVNAYKLLIEHGFKISACNKKGETAIHFAFKSNHQILKRDKGHLLFSITDDCNHSDPSGLTHLHIACALGNILVAKKYLNSNAGINAQCNSGLDCFLYYDHDGFTPLHFAVAHRRYDVLKLLLEHGSNAEVKDESGQTSLHLACGSYYEYEYPSSWENELNIIEILIKYGSDTNTEFSFDHEFITEIFAALHYFNNDTLSQSEFDVEAGIFINKSIETDYRLRQKEKLELLVKNGAVVSLSSTNINSVLCSILFCLETTRYPNSFEDISFDDSIYKEVIQLILANNDQIDMNSISKRNPLSMAVSYMSFDIVEIFLNYATDLSNLKFELRTGDLSEFHSLPTFECARNLIAIIKLLLDKNYKLTLEKNLILLKFLIHGLEECNCSRFIHPEHLGMAVNFFSSHHMPCLNKVVDRVKSAASIEDLGINLQSIEYAKLYIEEDIKKEVQKLLKMFKMSFIETAYYDNMKKEIEKMKSTNLRNGINLYDIMTKHPHEIYKYIQFSLFDKKIFDDFELYEPIIKGHFAKSVIRHYVEISAYDYLQFSLFSLLPYVCCNRILYYLNNKDIWYLCSAFSTHELNEN